MPRAMFIAVSLCRVWTSPYAFNGTMPVVADYDAQLLVGDFTRRAPTVFAPDDVRAVVAALRAFVRFVRTRVYPARLGHESKHITFIADAASPSSRRKCRAHLDLWGKGAQGTLNALHATRVLFLNFGARCKVRLTHRTAE